MTVDRGPAEGYIYGIRDPESGQFIFVGNSNQPWYSIVRHLTDSINPDVRDWAQSITERYGNKIEVLDRAVAEHYHNPSVPLPPVPPGVTRIEWEILGEEPHLYQPETKGAITLRPKTLKQQIIKQLLAEGHPLLNRSAGRPRKKST